MSSFSPMNIRRTFTGAPASTLVISRANWRKRSVSMFAVLAIKISKKAGSKSPASNWTRAASLVRSRCNDFNTTNIDADLVHCHTWYSHFGGILAKLNCGIPLVVTTHSLEPLRPWKREQLAGGYDFSLWIEKTALEMADAIIAVSGETKRDIERLFNVDPARVHVVHNGIDLDEYRQVEATDALVRY